MNTNVRKLNFADVFAVSRILDKMELRKEIAQYMEGLQNSRRSEQSLDVEQVGRDILLLLAQKLHKAEDEVCEFLASVAGLTAAEIKQASFNEITAILKELAEKDDLLAFFKQAFSVNAKKS